MNLFFSRLLSFLFSFFVGFKCCSGAKTAFHAKCVVCVTFLMPLFEKMERQ